MAEDTVFVNINYDFEDIKQWIHPTPFYIEILLS